MYFKMEMGSNCSEVSRFALEVYQFSQDKNMALMTVFKNIKQYLFILSSDPCFQ